MTQQQNEFLDYLDPPAQPVPTTDHLNFYEVQVIGSEDEPVANAAQHHSSGEIIVRQHIGGVEGQDGKLAEAESTVAQPVLGKAPRSDHSRNLAMLTEQNRYDSITIGGDAILDYEKVSQQELERDILRMKEQMTCMLGKVNRTIDNNRRALMSPEKYDIAHVNELLVKEKINSDRWLARSRRQLKGVTITLIQLQALAKQLESKPQVYQLEEQIDAAKSHVSELEKQIFVVKREIQEMSRKSLSSEGQCELYRLYRRLKYELHLQSGKEEQLKDTERQLNEKILSLIRKKMESDQQYTVVAAQAAQKRIPFGLSLRSKERRSLLIDVRNKQARRLALSRGVVDQRCSNMKKELEEIGKHLTKLNDDAIRINQQNSSFEWQIDICLDQQHEFTVENKSVACKSRFSPTKRHSRSSSHYSVEDVVNNFKGQKLEKIFAGTIGSVQFVDGGAELSGKTSRPRFPRVTTQNVQITPMDAYSPGLLQQKLKRPNAFMNVFPSKQASKILSRRKDGRDNKGQLTQSIRSNNGESAIKSRGSHRVSSVSNSHVISSQKGSHVFETINIERQLAFPGSNPQVNCTQERKTKRRRRSRVVHTLQNNFDSYTGELVELHEPMDRQQNQKKKSNLDSITIELEPRNGQSLKSSK